jgi:hypothetical protein
MEKTTTKQQFLNALTAYGECIEDVEVCYYAETPYRNYDSHLHAMISCSVLDLPDREFDVDGDTEGEPVIMYTHRYIYFKASNDEYEWVTAVPRHPQYIGTRIPWIG